MTQLSAKLRCGEWILLPRHKRIQKLVYCLIMNETSLFIGGEKFVQVEGILCRLPVDFHTLTHFLSQHFRHLVGIHIQPWQIGIGVFTAVIRLPLRLGLLLIGIGPVINGIIGKFALSQSLEGCTGQMERIPVDVLEGHIGLIGVNPFMGFINHQNIPENICHFLQLVIGTAKGLGPLQVLQRNKFDAFRIIINRVIIFISGKYSRLFLQYADF